jgi:hypothetical protein
LGAAMTSVNINRPAILSINSSRGVTRWVDRLLYWILQFEGKLCTPPRPLNAPVIGTCRR